MLWPPAGPFNRFISVYVDVKGDRRQAGFMKDSDKTDGWDITRTWHKRTTDGSQQEPQRGLVLSKHVQALIWVESLNPERHVEPV